ncbi:serpin family protein [Allokutzneria sp. NRRL B-24872]|uniref:serpin family protein n=1 Tax=Allokutzneria sp. NRRL B-24872 TaxID=1137961 RepID=UPI000A368AA0|nr:serpin family protein [Allokutzneria sp. NRRL B-24872]
MLPFTLALHHVLDPRANIAWAPYCVAKALREVAEGARGTTREELLAVLGDFAERDAEQLAPVPDHVEQPELAVSTTHWADPSVAKRPETRSAPFLAAPEEAKSLINADVAATTRGLIPSLIDQLPPGSVSALVVAVYLRSAWFTAFSEQLTHSAVFHAPDGERRVPTMRVVTEDAKYTTTGGWHVVNLPAAGGVTGVVLMPRGDLADQEHELTPESLTELLAPAPSAHVDLRLPRFRLSTGVELREALGRLGVVEAFTSGAELADGVPLGSVQHKAVLSIDEHGVEGAAATAAISWMSAPATPPVEVRIDRPFLFALRHDSSGALHFLARVTDPEG